MTQAEFYVAIKQARQDCLAINSSVNRKISEIYIDAADKVAEKIRTLELKSRGTGLTAASLRDLETQLRRTGENIAGGSQAAIVDGINKNTIITNDPHVEYINDVVKASETGKIAETTIREMYAAINRDIIDLTYSRLWSDGYNFSDRIWGGTSKIKEGKSITGLVGAWQDEVKRVVNSGIAQNRDVLQIAKDLEIYARKGKPALIKRYGPLERGTKQFARRIPKGIDWRALRLARSELYISLQESAKKQGHNNPGVKAYDWNLTSGGVHDCVCPDLAANSPYLENEVPDFPHADCLCQITFRIRGRDEFVQDVIGWGKGIEAPYLGEWYRQVYLPFEK